MRPLLPWAVGLPDGCQPARKTTGKQRNRIYCAERILQVIREAESPLEYPHLESLTEEELWR